MDDDSPQAFGLCLCDECKPPAPRAKRLLDSTEQVQALQSAKKACPLSHLCNTPGPSGTLPLCSPDPACCQGSSLFLADAGHDDLVASSASKYDDVAVSLDTTRCFDDSEPDDSLLELSDGEGGNSPFNYTEEEIQKILADDGVESEWYLTRRSSLSQNGSGESGKDEGGSCVGTSIVGGGAEITAPPDVPLPREGSPLGSECCPDLSKEGTGLGEDHLPSAQVTRMLFELDIQELLSLSPIDADLGDEPLEDSCSEEAEREASVAIVNDCLECEQTTGSCVLEGSSEELVSDGQQSPGVDCLGESPFAGGDVSDFCGDSMERSMSPSDLTGGQSTAEELSPPRLLRCSTPLAGSGNRELSETAQDWFSRTLDSPEGARGQESSEAEQPPSSKLSVITIVRIEQEETTSGKKPGKVIPVPQEEERLNRWMCISEEKLERKKCSYPECAYPYEEKGSSYTR
ncbi:S100P-binding protein [Aegotheles albertisi]